jgi:hypothetical protein
MCGVCVWCVWVGGDVLSSSQCEKCGKWRVLSEPWTGERVRTSSRCCHTR